MAGSKVKIVGMRDVVCEDWEGENRDRGYLTETEARED
jgi:hypothetical protein